MSIRGRRFNRVSSIRSIEFWWCASSPRRPFGNFTWKSLKAMPFNFVRTIASENPWIPAVLQWHVDPFEIGAIHG